MRPLTRIYDVALLDLDGVVYVGDQPVGHAQQSLAAARAAGMRLAFVTNNASRPVEAVAAKLTAMGVQAAPDEVVSSAQAAARLLDELLPAGSRVLVVGGQGLDAALRERGIVPVDTFDAEPAAVVQGFTPDLSWRSLAEGCYAVSAGLPWVATNMDATIPTSRGLAPGNGALVDAVRTATGRDPVVAGKPEPPMHREAVVRTGARRPLVVGDRLDTDIEGANAAGVDSLLVMTGVTDPVDVVLAPDRLRPTYVGLDLRVLHDSPEAVVVKAGQTSHGRWRAAVEGQVLRLWRDERPSGQPEVDALRAACGATWAVDGEVDIASVHAALDTAGWRRRP